MGNYRFKLSDMVPNAWLCKLRDMNKARKSQSQERHTSSNQESLHSQHPRKEESLLPSRASYHFSNRTEAEKPHTSPLHPRASDTLFPQQSPTKCKKSCRKPIGHPSKLLSSGLNPGNDQVDALLDAICGFKLASSAYELPKRELELPQIMTKLASKERKQNNGRSSPTGSHRLRTRSISPRLAATKKVQVGRKSVSKQNKTVSKGFAVMKTSTNPQKDFKDSMVEMIRENNIKTAKELEELLACYLLLNSDEYHGVIVEVFEHIWFDLTNIIS